MIAVCAALRSYVKKEYGVVLRDDALRVAEPARSATYKQVKNRIAGTEHLFSEVELLPESGMLIVLPLEKYNADKLKLVHFRLKLNEFRQLVAYTKEESAKHTAREESKAVKVAKEPKSSEPKVTKMLDMSLLGL